MGKKEKIARVTQKLQDNAIAKSVETITKILSSNEVKLSSKQYFFDKACEFAVDNVEYMHSLEELAKIHHLSVHAEDTNAKSSQPLHFVESIGESSPDV